MNDDDVRRLAAELDAAVPKQGAKLLISYDDENRVYCEFIANRAGYLRTGIEMLHAAVEPLGPGEYVTPVGLNYLVGEGGLLLRRLTRREDVEAAFQPSRGAKATWKHKAAGLGCVTLVLCLTAFALIGVAQVLSWIFGR